MDEKPDQGTPRAVQACHELLAWLIPLLDQFPRSRCGWPRRTRPTSAD